MLDAILSVLDTVAKMLALLAYCSIWVFLGVCLDKFICRFLRNADRL
jgi:hypothetical protein